MSKGRQLTPVSSLEFAVRAWEDLWYLIELRERARAALKQPLEFNPPRRALDNYRHFRKFLLHKQPDGKTLTMADFGAPSQPWFYSFWSHLPAVISGWSWNSRRVYHLQPGLQKVLEHTSLEGMTWEDIHLPFRSFAIHLSIPQKTANGRECDLILVHAGTDGTWAFATLRSDLRDYEQVNRDHLEKLLRKRKYSLLRNELDRVVPQIELLQGAFMMVGQNDKAETLLACVEKGTEQEWLRGTKTVGKDALKAVQVAMLRVAFGLPLYLSSLPSRHNNVQPTAKEDVGGQITFPSGKVDPRAISSEAELFTVSSRIDLSSIERLFFGLEGSEDEQKAVREWVHANRKSCHWQPGFWRRRPGYGDDPIAPKVVRVSPHLVAKDWLPEFALPGGTEAKVT
jgi:hypothetical protein